MLATPTPEHTADHDGKDLMTHIETMSPGGSPVTRSEMLDMLGPLHICLQRMESNLEQLARTHKRSLELSEPTDNDTPCTAADLLAPQTSFKVSLMEESKFKQQVPPSSSTVEPTHLRAVSPRSDSNSEVEKNDHVVNVENSPAPSRNSRNSTKSQKLLRRQGSQCSKDTKDQRAVLQLAEHITIKHALKSIECGHVFRPTRMERLVMHLESCFRWWDTIQEPERTGPIAKIVTSHHFETCCMLAIVTNSGLVAVGADWEMRHTGMTQPESLRAMEVGFLFYFVIELLLRLVAHGCFFFLNHDMHWNIFDFVLVGISLLDFIVEQVMQSQDRSKSNVAFMRMLRLLKLARIFRALRSFRFFTQLAILLESFEKSFVSLFWGFVLLAFVLYLFALIFMQALSEYMNANMDLDSDRRQHIMDKFGSLGATLLSLYMSVTGGEDWCIYYGIMQSVGAAYGAVFILFTFFFLFALFNILTGSIVEKAMASSKPDRTDLILNQRKVFFEQRAEFLEICEKMDKDGSGTISFEEFANWMANPVMLAYMASIGVELHDVQLFFATVSAQQGGDFDDSGDVPIDHFVDGCMQMKGSATALDMQRQLFEMHLVQEELKDVQHSLRHISQRLEQTSTQPQLCASGFTANDVSSLGYKVTAAI